jgi:hypothetical protein
MMNGFESNMGVADESGTQLAAINAVAAAVSDAPKRVRILLEENDNIPPTGQFIGVNGRGFMLRAGEEAEVPVEVIGALEGAVQDVPIVNPVTQQVEGYRKKLRFPFRVIARDI